MMVDPDGGAIVPRQHAGMTTDQNKALAREFFARFSGYDCPQPV